LPVRGLAHRAHRRRCGGAPIPEVIFEKSSEDTVLRKLLWFLEGGEVSEKHWRDILSVLRVSGAVVDDAYLAAWASRSKLSALLARARTARAPA